MNERTELSLFTRKVLIVVAIVLVLLFLFAIRRVVLIVFIAGVLASGIAPAVRRVRVLSRHWMRRRIQRGAAVAIVYLPFVITAVLVATFVVPNLLIESKELASKLPAQIETKLLKPLDQYIPATQVRQLLFDHEGDRSEQVFVYIRGAANVIGSLVAILVLIFYMLIDTERLRNMFLIFFPAPERGRRRQMIRRISKRMSSWLAGQLLLAGVIGLATFIGLLALRVPYALPLAVVAAIGEMVPVIGPIIGAVPALTIALFESPEKFWFVLVLAIGIQQVENLVLVPRVMGKKVSVSPLAVFVAFMAGASLLGIVGAIMAIPAAAIIQVVFEESMIKPRERRRDRDRPGTLVKPDA